MLVSEIATRVKRQFGDEVGVQITDQDIIRWINDAQRELALNNNLSQKKATGTVTAGVADVVLPTDVLTLITVKWQNQKLQPISMHDADEMTVDPSQTGTPTSFYVFAGKVTLIPAPAVSDSSSLVIYYTASPVEVTATTDTPALPLQYHQRILEFCLAQAAELDENDSRYQMKMGEFRNNTQMMKDNSEWDQRDAYPSISVSSRDAGDIVPDGIGLVW